jgi:hypothetical protein
MEWRTSSGFSRIFYSSSFIVQICKDINYMEMLENYRNLNRALKTHHVMQKIFFQKLVWVNYLKNKLLVRKSKELKFFFNNRWAFKV